MLYTLLGVQSGLYENECQATQRAILAELKKINRSINSPSPINPSFTKQKSSRQVHVVSINGKPTDEYHYI